MSVVGGGDGETENFQLPLEIPVKNMQKSHSKSFRPLLWGVKTCCHLSPLPFFIFSLILFPCCFAASLVTSLCLQRIYRSGSGTFSLLIKLLICRSSTDKRLHLKTCITYVRVFLLVSFVFVFVLWFFMETGLLLIITFLMNRILTLIWWMSHFLYHSILFQPKFLFQQHYCFIIWIAFTTWVYILLLVQLKYCVSCYVLALAVNFQL